MSDAAQIQNPAPDNHNDDVREAINQLKEASGAPADEPKVQIVLDKPRDDQGKFVKDSKPQRETLSIKPKEVSQAPEPAAKQEVQAPVSQETPAAVAPEAPRSWKAEFKAQFGTLPPALQQEILRREQDFEKQMSVHDEHRLTGKKVAEMVTPYLPTIRAEGADPLKAFGDYLQTAHVLRSGTPTQKAQSIASVMQAFRVDPSTLFSILQGGNVVTGNSPQPGVFDPRVANLEAQLQRIERERQEEIQRRQLEEQHQLQSQIDGFASQPGHEHFENVKVRMGHLLESGQAKDMEDAYQQAIWSDPGIRGSLLEAQKRESEGQRLTELQAKTERARSASLSVTGSPGGTAPPRLNGSVGSIEDDLRAAMRSHAGRI